VYSYPFDLTTAYNHLILVGSFSSEAYATVIFLGVQTTPEPASLALFAGGLLGILLARRAARRA
jgi:hypothetical protein